jgi:hypothetical protein
VSQPKKHKATRDGAVVGSMYYVFGHEVVLGLATHVLEDRRGSANIPSGGSRSLAEVVRCPLEAGFVDRAECEV